MSAAFENLPGRLRIVVLGYLVRGPMGGMAWHHLQYVMGLRDLGHAVYFLEDSGDNEYCCYDPARGVADANPEYGLKFAADCFARFHHDEKWAYYDAHTSRWLGPCAGRIPALLKDTDLLINLSCSNVLRPWFDDIAVRVLVDTDPLFTQVRHLTDPARMALAKRHNRFLTFAENIRSDNCTIPDDGFPWIPTRQPIVLEAWPVTPPLQTGKFTTVMQWDSYPALEYRGRTYGMKSKAFSDYLDLPRKCGPIFELAVGGVSAPRPLLREKGWQLSNPNQVAKDPWSYQRFIQQSRAEFTVAKHGYVASRSGWFSERSAAYLASGRPVVTQETGFSDWLPAGQAVLSFKTPGDAEAAIDDVNRRYELHCSTAREIAKEYFDARKILPRVIEEAMGSFRV